MKEESRMYKGCEYVTAKEFASRVEKTPQTINKYIREGKLAASDVFHVGIVYLKWETQKDRFEEILRKNAKKTNKKYRKQPTQTTSAKGLSPSSGIKTLEDGEQEAVSSEELKVGDDTIVLADIDPMLYKSCWIPDGDGNPIYNPITGKPELDMERLKDTLVVMLSRQKLDRENGKLIPKTDIEPTISYIGRKISQYVSSIHSRFGSIYGAEVEKILKRELTADEQTRFANVLKKDEAKFLSEIQTEFRRISDEIGE